MGPDCNAIAAAVIAVAIGFMNADFSTLCAKTGEQVPPRSGSEDPALPAQMTHGEGLRSNLPPKNRAWHEACNSTGRE
jgi:hypothetical protein